ncbi:MULTISPECIES: AbrB family transcriptional regulator [Burkholderia]|uniref:AbrB/MazE/SpoVT family DNA-binding domain-containing protein n=1 Tax=Burkholderia TaxID=32008 RepID=UPI000487B5F5|nr:MULTISPECIES: AbrB family transcriptional regulator [Burkholderia]
MQVAKWGNSLAVRLPASVVDSPRVFAVSRKPRPDELLERLRRFRGKLPADFKFSRDDANEQD